MSVRSLTTSTVAVAFFAALAAACGDSGTDTSTASSTTSAGGATSSSTSAGGAGGASTSAGGAGGSATSTGGASTGGGGAGGGATSTGGAGSGGSGAGGGTPTSTVRIVAGNLSTGSGQTWNIGQGIRILQGIKGDIMLVQEFNYGMNDAAAIQSFADQVCGTDCVAVRGPTAQIPNGIVSRYPIIDSGSVTDPYVTNRNFVWARIDVPGTRDLYAFSVHLLTSSATNRDLEAAALNDVIANLVPDDDLLVVGGDFNTETRTEAALVTLSQNVVIGSPWPVDQLANDNTNAPRTKPFDWVLVDSDLDALVVPTVIGANSFPDGLVVDTRVYTPITDLSPALASDSAASGMQHMAVVKDYVIQ
jgi:endonuclease/exonuclease/phosphatase family metal-dependent hydrolase